MSVGEYDPDLRRETPLAGRIRDLIRATGPLPVERYIDVSLTDAEHGYYRRRPAIGASADFITAPEISQVFGELIGLWAAVVWQQMGCPSRVTLLEFGPGRGTMMADALRAAVQAPGFAAALSVVLVEPNEALRPIQGATLDRYRSILSHAAPGGRLPDGPLIVLANEVLDCVPVCQIVRDGADTWCERVVMVDEAGRLQFGVGMAQDRGALPLEHPTKGRGPLETLRNGFRDCGPGGALAVAEPSSAGTGEAPPSSAPVQAAPPPLSPPHGGEGDDQRNGRWCGAMDADLSPSDQPSIVASPSPLWGGDRGGGNARHLERSWLERRARLLDEAPPGSIAEDRDFRGLAKELLRVARDAPLAALFIDYGHVESGLGDTVQAVRGHKPEHPLTSPGEADLTAQVDFAALAAMVRDEAGAGLAIDGPVTQGEFLGRLGIIERASRLMARNPAQAATIEAGIARLLSPIGMGTRFKVIGIRSSHLPTLPGFKGAPR